MRRDAQVGRAQSNYKTEPVRQELVSSGATGSPVMVLRAPYKPPGMLLSDILIKP